MLIEQESHNLTMEHQSCNYSIYKRLNRLRNLFPACIVKFNMPSEWLYYPVYGICTEIIIWSAGNFTE